MNVYIGPRVSGKTTKAIEYCLEHKCTLVVALSVTADNIERENKELECISWYQFINSSTIGNHNRYVIDDISRCIEISLGINIEAITVQGLAVPMVTLIEQKGLLEQKEIMTKDEFKKSFPGVNI